MLDRQAGEDEDRTGCRQRRAPLQAGVQAEQRMTPAAAAAMGGARAEPNDVRNMNFSARGSAPDEGASFPGGIQKALSDMPQQVILLFHENQRSDVVLGLKVARCSIRAASRTHVAQGVQDQDAGSACPGEAGQRSEFLRLAPPVGIVKLLGRKPR